MKSAGSITKKSALEVSEDGSVSKEVVYEKGKKITETEY